MSAPTFLTPLLMQTTALRTVSVAIEPVAHSVAIRRAEAARTAEVADEMARERQGFMTTARIRRQQQASRPARGGACRRPRRDALRRLRHGLGARAPRSSSASRAEVEHAAAARAPGAAAPLRRAGRRLHLHPAARRGGCGDLLRPQLLPGRAPRPRGDDRPLPGRLSVPRRRAAPAPPASTSAATPTAAPGSRPLGSSTAGDSCGART